MEHFSNNEYIDQCASSSSAAPAPPSPPLRQHLLDNNETAAHHRTLEMKVTDTRDGLLGSASLETSGGGGGTAELFNLHHQQFGGLAFTAATPSAPHPLAAECVPAVLATTPGGNGGDSALDSSLPGTIGSHRSPEAASLSLRDDCDGPPRGVGFGGGWGGVVAPGSAATEDISPSILALQPLMSHVNLDDCELGDDPTSSDPTLRSAGERKLTHASECVNVYVANLPPTADASKIRDVFASVGRVLHVKVLLDIATGVSRGIAFVMFEDLPTAKKACALKNKTVVDGAVLQVRLAERSALHTSLSTHVWSNVVYIRNVPGAVVKESVREYCSQRYGTVTDVISHPQSCELGGPSPFNMVFVTFESVEDACRCVEGVDGKSPFPVPPGPHHPFTMAKMINDMGGEMRKSILLRRRSTTTTTTTTPNGTSATTLVHHNNGDGGSTPNGHSSSSPSSSILHHNTPSQSLPQSAVQQYQYGPPTQHRGVAPPPPQYISPNVAYLTHPQMQANQQPQQHFMHMSTQGYSVVPMSVGPVGTPSPGSAALTPMQPQLVYQQQHQHHMSSPPQQVPYYTVSAHHTPMSNSMSLGTTAVGGGSSMGSTHPAYPQQHTPQQFVLDPPQAQHHHHHQGTSYQFFNGPQHHVHSSGQQVVYVSLPPQQQPHHQQVQQQQQQQQQQYFVVGPQHQQQRHY